MRIVLVLTSWFILFICTACTVNVTPVATDTARLNPADNSLTETQGQVSVTARLDELSVSAYEMVDNITSFHLQVDNQSDQQVEFPAANFILKDSASRQYRTISPEEVREIVSKDTVYLMPYPYVGYYYLQDQQTAAYMDSFSSSLPFYAEYHPQDIFTRALPEGPILPASNISGVIYFIVDLARTDGFELQYYVDESLGGEPRYSFPFLVEK